MLIGPISLIFCGHLGDPIQLDGAALGISMINVTCVAIAQGLGTACDTFFSQTFGSNNKKLVGVYVQKAVYIFLLALMPCYAIHLNLGSFLRLVGQNPEVSRLAGRYMVIFMPGALSVFMYIVLVKYIQNQNIVLPNVVIGIIANILNAVLHYVFLYQLHWGTDGSALAQVCAYFTLFALTFLYIVWTKAYKDTWGGWTMDSLQDWGKFARISIPGMLMLCMEWWGFEIGVFLTGLLGTTELGAQAVLLQIDSLWFQVPLGIQISTSICIGQLLGAGDEMGAKTAARLSIAIIIVISLFPLVLFLLFQYQLPYIFTNVSEVAALTSKLMPIVMIYLFFDGIATASKGILYGTGRQVYGAVLLFISYYVLALPIGIPLMFLTWLRSAGTFHIVTQSKI
ncbi:hypothetical protein NP493_810g01019 [Ridgeia piscesae]|uniref:Uncharacterized protein n=1 Tax=Ridgeia piscesae TaxID=27915 RepID=A0AAD9NMY4_RIDPI|nr:hypothetical protein NP493_810g01019 [Ridgeia piscesae]